MGFVLRNYILSSYDYIALARAAGIGTHFIQAIRKAE